MKPKPTDINDDIRDIVFRICKEYLTSAKNRQSLYEEAMKMFQHGYSLDEVHVSMNRICETMDDMYSSYCW